MADGGIWYKLIEVADIDWGQIIRQVIAGLPWWVWLFLLLGLVMSVLQEGRAGGLRSVSGRGPHFRSLANLIYYHLFEKKQIEKTGMAEIDRMSGGQFERFLGNLFAGLGFKVERVGTNYSDHRGDFWADLIIEKDGIRTSVQAKNYGSLVGINAVREVLGAKSYYKCQKAVVVTNNYFSHDAQVQAKASDVQLWNRDKFIKVILVVKGKA